MSLPFTGTALGSGGVGGTGGTPDPHAASHANGGSDELALDASQITTGTVADARLPSTLVDGPGTSVDSEVALFSGTGGVLIKRASVTGLAKLTSGVLSAATAGTDYLVTANATQSAVYSATFSNGIQTGNMSGGSDTTKTLVANTVYYSKFLVPSNLSVVRSVDIRITSGVAATSVRFGFYSVGSDGLPGTLVANSESGSLDSSTGTTRTYTPGSSLVLVGGQMYYLAIVSDGAITLRAAPSGAHIQTSCLSGSGALQLGYTAAFTYGTLPSTATAPTAEANGVFPCVYIVYTS